MLNGNLTANAIQRGFLREISENINDVNAPKKIARFEIQSKVKIPVHDDFNELIEVSVVVKKKSSKYKRFFIRKTASSELSN